jgi:DNA-binding transcriptional ArsR family regulator
VAVIRAALRIRPDGVLIWRKRRSRRAIRGQFNLLRANKPAGHVIAGRGRVVQMTDHKGHSRMIAATRAAWAVHHGAWPSAPVRFVEAEDDYRADNLALDEKPRRSWGCTAGKQSQAADIDLLTAMADHPEASVTRLASMVDSAQPCVSRRLRKLAEQGLVEAPRCGAGRSWFLTESGREQALVDPPPAPRNGHVVTPWLKPLIIVPPDPTMLGGGVRLIARFG